MTFNERKITSKLTDLQVKLKEMNSLMNSIPCLSIDGFQAMTDPERDWKTNILTLFNATGIYKSWILTLSNPSEHSHPNTVQIQFINNIVRNQVYKILSQYIIEHEYDVLISKEDLFFNKDFS